MTDFLAAVAFFVAFAGALVTFIGVDLTVFTVAVVRALVLGLGARTDTLTTDLLAGALAFSLVITVFAVVGFLVTGLVF